ncbi:putative holin-like toxin [Lactobacillus intestinalis]
MNFRYNYTGRKSYKMKLFFVFPPGNRYQFQNSVYEAISLILLFGTFVLALLTYIDNHNKNKKSHSIYNF